MKLKGLLASGKTVVVAESVTAGGIGFNLTSVPGASNFFWGGFITYSNSSKVSLLGVKQSTLDQFGAVSPEVVMEMAIGARSRTGCDIGLSITGDAGPDPMKKVGEVFIGLSQSELTIFKELKLSGTREQIRETAINEAIDFLNENVSNVNS